MRAALCRDYGPPESIAIADLPDRALAPGEVRVRINAAAVNFPDVLLIANRYQMSIPVPFIPGSEFAGIVTEVAAPVDGASKAPNVGTRVFGSCLSGAFANEIVVTTSSITQIPNGVNDHHAAAFGVAHRTAYHVLRSFAKVQPGDELIVLGAGGGVGLAAVQLGTVLGASVTAVASGQAKLDVAAAHGARHLIDHTTQPLREALRSVLAQGADAVIDPVGGDLSEPALRALRYGGRFVTVGYASGTIPKIPLNLVLLKGMQIRGFQMIDFLMNEPAALARNEAELMTLLAEGHATPHIGAVFDFDQVGEALRYVAEGKAIGKVVLDISA